MRSEKMTIEKIVEHLENEIKRTDNLIIENNDPFDMHRKYVVGYNEGLRDVLAFVKNENRFPDFDDDEGF